jgi:glycosyltransferase involved in cell wall biosynthesis
MKIALLSAIAWRTPPRQYGPWEQVVSNIAEGLVASGIDVTLFATGDSITAGKLAHCIDTGYAENPDADAKVSECLHISQVMERASEFDVIHNNFDFLPLTYSKLIKTPLLTTVHGFSSQKIVPVYKKYNEISHYVSISNSDRNSELDYIATVYNGINTDEFTFEEKPDNYLLFLGRIHPEKGAWDAIQVAKKTGKKLIIAGLVQDTNYYEEKIKPFINNDDIVYAGNCGPVERDALLGKAFALLHLIHFNEPFGLSVAEAMCCGTPVIAFNRGSMPELIADNQTGFLVDTIDEAVEAVQQISSINRKACRDRVVSLFSKEKMTEDYIKVYQKILER